MGSRAIILASLMAMRCSQPAPTEADAGEEVSLPHPDGCTVGVCSLNDVGEPCGACDDLPNHTHTTCQIQGSPDAPSAMTPVRAFPNLVFNRPVHLANAGDGSDRLFVVEKLGTIAVFPNKDNALASEKTTFLDITDRVNAGPNEAGLLSVAFHPQYADNGHFFVNYTGNVGNTLTSFTSRFTVTADPAVADPDSELVIHSVGQPFGNHNGGQIAFGPDGMLYIGYGDGGSANDPFNNGQDLDSVLGKMMRIDIDQTDPGLSYAVPPDNPFYDATGGGIAREIWAWGLRNPWRFSFDRLTGKLWTADVGQDAWEEVHIIEGGRNYGWNIMEGNHCFKPKIGCDMEGLEPAIAEYDHTVGKSITGGFVYRGKKQPQLYGAYLYTDYLTGVVFAARFEDGDEAEVTTLVQASNLAASSFGEDEGGEVFIVDFPFFSPTQGKLWKLQNTAAAAGPSATFPLTLSATGCFDDLPSLTPAPGLVEYTVNSPLWHDGSDSVRHVVMPAGGRFRVSPDGRWKLPAGAKLIKTFQYTRADGSTVRTETRFVLAEEEGIRAYTYRWNPEQTDAVLTNEAQEIPIQLDSGAATWHVPSRSQCRTCHNKATGEYLGWRTGQLNAVMDYTDVSVNQLTMFELFGWMSEPLENTEAWPAPHDTEADLSERARAALDANCASCHVENGPTTVKLDLKFGTPLSETLACGAKPENGDLGLADAKIIAPGAPGSSTLVQRMKILGSDRMPNLGSFVIDHKTVGLIEQWVSGLSSCSD